MEPFTEIGIGSGTPVACNWGFQRNYVFFREERRDYKRRKKNGGFQKDPRGMSIRRSGVYRGFVHMGKRESA